MNGYRVLVLEGGANGKGLINWNFLGGVKMAVNFVNVQAYEAPNKKGGCVYAGKMVVEGSNNSVLDADVQSRLNSLMAKINDPESFAGSFAEALAETQRQAQAIIDKIAAGQTPTAAELRKFKSVCKAVETGVNGWKTDIETQFPAPRDGIVSQVLDSLEIYKNQLLAIANCAGGGSGGGGGGNFQKYNLTFLVCNYADAAIAAAGINRQAGKLGLTENREEFVRKVLAEIKKAIKDNIPSINIGKILSKDFPLNCEINAITLTLDGRDVTITSFSAGKEGNYILNIESFLRLQTYENELVFYDGPNQAGNRNLGIQADAKNLGYILDYLGILSDPSSCKLLDQIEPDVRSSVTNGILNVPNGCIQRLSVGKKEQYLTLLFTGEPAALSDNYEKAVLKLLKNSSTVDADNLLAFIRRKEYHKIIYSKAFDTNYAIEFSTILYDYSKKSVPADEKLWIGTHFVTERKSINHHDDIQSDVVLSKLYLVVEPNLDGSISVQSVLENNSGSKIVLDIRKYDPYDVVKVYYYTALTKLGDLSSATLVPEGAYQIPAGTLWAYYEMQRNNQVNFVITLATTTLVAATGSGVVLVTLDILVGATDIYFHYYGGQEEVLKLDNGAEKVEIIDNAILIYYLGSSAASIYRSGVSVRSLAIEGRSGVNLSGLFKNLTYDFTGFNRVLANDGFIDIVIHFKNGKFVAMVEEGGILVERAIDDATFAKFIDDLPSGQVRLLSCNSIEAAKDLSKRVNRPLVASDGWVDLFANGSITSESSFVKLNEGEEVKQLGKSTSQAVGEKIRLGVTGAGRFIAKSGNELKTYLNAIVNKPLGKTYNGNMYRSIGKQYNNPIEIHQGAINANYRYSRPGEGGLYLSKTQVGNMTEISHYGDLSNYKTYEYANVQIDNMLDLTDDMVMQQIGVDFDLLTRTSSNLDEAYEFTHEIGTWAASKGYKGLIVPGARGSKDYVNTIIFKQADVNKALGNITPTIINH